MRKIIILLVLSTLIYSCKKQGLNSYLQSVGSENIVAVQLHPNSPVLIADGQSELKFKVKAFMEIVNEDGKKDTVPFNLDKLEDGLIEINSSKNERIDGDTYRTSDIHNGSIDFTCKIGSVTSKPIQVKLIEKPNPTFKSVTVPINFHILHNAKQDDMARGITDEFLQSLIDRLNKVFANTFALNPVGVDSKIKFVIKQKIVKNVGDLKINELNKYIVDNAIVNPLNELNIWICNTNSASYTNLPSYTANQDVTIPGLTLKYVEDPATIKFTDPHQAGIILPITNIFSIAAGQKPRMEHVIGRFFGLIATKHNAPELPQGVDDIDFCSDTYSYESKYLRPEKWTATSKSKPNKIYYDSFNIMDEFTASTTVSYEQSLRIHQVIKNCPLRQFN